MTKKLTVWEAMRAADMAHVNLLRLQSLLPAKGTSTLPPAAQLGETEYSEPVHILLQIYVFLIQQFADAGVVTGILKCPGFVDWVTSEVTLSRTQSRAQFLCIIDNRYVSWTLEKRLWDTWSAEFIEQVGTPVFSTAVNMRNLADTPLRKIRE